MDVRNCKSCGNLFNFAGRNICPTCVRKLEAKFDKVKAYIRENPNASIAEVAEETEVTVNQIRNWIREERLILSNESSIGIDCERCGKPIRVGRFCNDCKRQFTQDLEGVTKKAVKVEPKKDAKESGKDRMHFIHR